MAHLHIHYLTEHFKEHLNRSTESVHTFTQLLCINSPWEIILKTLYCYTTIPHTSTKDKSTSAKNIFAGAYHAQKKYICRKIYMSIANLARLCVLKPGWAHIWRWYTQDVCARYHHNELHRDRTALCAASWTLDIQFSVLLLSAEKNSLNWHSTTEFKQHVLCTQEQNQN